MLDIMPAFSRPYPAASPLPDCRNFEAAVRLVNKGEDIPPLSEAYIHKYLEDMALLELIERPKIFL